MRGCLGLPFRLAGLVLLGFLAWAAWENREPIRRWVHRATADPAPAADAAAPVETARRSGLARLDSLERGRADSVLLTEREVQAVFASRVADRSGGALDSVEIALGEGDVTVRARLDGERLPRAGLGPLAEWVAGRQPVEARGALGLRRLGTGQWRLAVLKIRGVPLPRALWERLAALVVPGQDAEITFPVPPWVTGVQVTPAAMVLYGRGGR